MKLCGVALQSDCISGGKSGSSSVSVLLLLGHRDAEVPGGWAETRVTERLERRRHRTEWLSTDFCK